MHTIAERFYQADQSWYYEWVLNARTRRYKIEIRRNTYDEQSYLRGYCYDQDTTKWNMLVARPICGAACDKPRMFVKELFVQDAQSVLAELQQIVTGDIDDRNTCGS